MNHLKGVASILPPMIITISSVSLISGSQPRLPPGELSNMKPKSAKPQKPFVMGSDARAGMWVCFSQGWEPPAPFAQENGHRSCFLRDERGAAGRRREARAESGQHLGWMNLAPVSNPRALRVPWPQLLLSPPVPSSWPTAQLSKPDLNPDPPQLGFQG